MNLDTNPMVSNSIASIPGGGLRVFKYHALGNSYLVLDPRYCGEHAGLFDVSKGGALQPSAHLVRILCDKSWGIGSNGLLFGPFHSSTTSALGLSIINSDGTRAGFSGNGVRIFAKYLLDAGYTRPGARINVEIITENPTAPNNVAPVRILDNVDPRIEVTVPCAPRFGIDAVAANAALVQVKRIAGLAEDKSYSVAPLAQVGARSTGSSATWSNSTLLDIGNPHCVTFVANKDQLPSSQELAADDNTLRTIAFRPDTDSRTTAVFANGANLQWVHIGSRSHLDLVIYERGEGVTPASGSSASAAACAAFARGLINPAVDVVMPGGTLAIRIDGTADKIRTVTLSGFATRILEGCVDTRIFV
jgi:diaminopimelate epimerase